MNINTNHGFVAITGNACDESDPQSIVAFTGTQGEPISRTFWHCLNVG